MLIFIGITCGACFAIGYFVGSAQRVDKGNEIKPKSNDRESPMVTLIKEKLNSCRTLEGTAFICDKCHDKFTDYHAFGKHIIEHAKQEGTYVA